MIRKLVNFELSEEMEKGFFFHLVMSVRQDPQTFRFHLPMLYH